MSWKRDPLVGYVLLELIAHRMEEMLRCNEFEMVNSSRLSFARMNFMGAEM
jgi:hypothetical protein